MEYQIRQSDNRHQHFVETLHSGEWKIEKVFYSNKQCEDYIKASKIINSMRE